MVQQEQVGSCFIRRLVRLRLKAHVLYVCCWRLIELTRAAGVESLRDSRAPALSPAPLQHTLHSADHCVFVTQLVILSSLFELLVQQQSENVRV